MGRYINYSHLDEPYVTSDRTDNTIDAVLSLIDRYVKALQEGSSEELKAIFLPMASYYFYRDDKLVGGSIEILYRTVDKTPISGEIAYDVKVVTVSEKIAVAMLNLSNIGGVHIVDMFTMVKDDSVWKIASKVAYRPS